MSTSLRWPLIVLATGAALLLGAWSVDGLVRHGEVWRGVEIAGKSVDGLGEEALRREVMTLAEEIADAPLAIQAPTARFAGTAGDWGVEVDIDATMAAAMAVGRGSVPSSVSTWAAGWFTETEVAPVLTIDRQAVAAAIASRPDAVASEPIDPSFEAVAGVIEVFEGRPGQRLDAEALAAALATAVSDNRLPAEIVIDWTPIPPRFDAADLQRGLADAESLIDSPIQVRINDRSAVIPPETARRWIRSTTETGELLATFDEVAARTDLAVRLADLATTQAPPEFVINDGQLEVTLGEPVLVCCEAPVASLVEHAARTGDVAVLEAMQRDDDGGQAIADAFGIRQPIAEFTTNHSCCQSRVTNIHRMADLVRGAIIEPGATFSINEYVGKRTVENGFVSAGAIERGHLVEDVGGGVSQFATTLFNAAFFAGLDFADYQSHTIYFSRYPRGREATLGHPAPDLALTNNTPYAVLIWPTYTDTSITVELWSTPYFEVEQTGQSSSRWGTACTRWDTFRTRIAPDGTELKDSVFATYRPAEGIDCLGNRIPPPRS